MKLAFLVHSADISGGTYVIFQHALYLQSKSIDVTIILEKLPEPHEIAWHDSATRLKFSTFKQEAESEYDVVIATWWASTFNLQRIKSKSYIYFVQSIESRFYPEKEFPARFLADCTYLYDIPVITEASWIKEKLEQEFSRHVGLALNGIRKDIYNPDGASLEPRDPAKLRVLVEGPMMVDFKNVPKALDICIRSNADEVWLLTSTQNITDYPGVDRIFSRVPITETAKIYRSCDVIVKLSYVEGMFGPPLEMFHCGGTAIVYAVTGHEEYIRNRQNSLVLPKDDETGVLKAINQLKNNYQLLSDLKSNALKTAQDWPDWEKSSSQFHQAILELKDFSNETQSSLKAKTELLFKGYDKLVNSPDKEEIEKDKRYLEALLNEKTETLNLILSSGSFRFCQKIRSYGKIKPLFNRLRGNT